MTPPQEVLAFWFGDPPVAQARPEWFRKDDAFDATIRLRFGALIDALLDPAAALPPAWRADDARTRLARIVVLDQFTRNVGRGTPRAFAGDAQALRIAEQLRATGEDRRLAPLERWFAYLPLEHAESAEVQAQSLAAFAELAAEHPAQADALDWAERHAAVIRRFGRYPHRNLALGRVSTPEEEAFLREPGSAF